MFSFHLFSHMEKYNSHDFCFFMFHTKIGFIHPSPEIWAFHKNVIHMFLMDGNKI